MRQRNRRCDEPRSAPELKQTPVDKFRTGTFLVFIDNIDAVIKKQLGAYTGVAARFGFLRKLKNLPDDEVVSNAERLCQAYSVDLEANLSDELLHFPSL